MLAISSSKSTRQITPNVLPASIKHSGPIASAPRHWAPEIDSRGGNSNESGSRTSTAYFRGRKLRGRAIALPDGYEGVILEKTDKKIVQKPTAEQLRQMEMDAEDGEEPEKTPEIYMMQPVGKFDELMVWGHEMVPDDDDEYIKGVAEWIRFAEAMHTGERAASIEASTCNEIMKETR